MRTTGSIWKWLVIAAGIILLLVSVIYSNYLARALAESERDKVELYLKTLEDILDVSDLNRDVRYQQEVLQILDNIQVIFVDEQDEISYGMNFGKERDEDIEFLEKELRKINNIGTEPLSGWGGYTDKIYYKQSRLITLLSYFPLLQLFLILGFVLVGYLGLTAARKAEQNRVWVGLAKETAHQLGTPISAILAWIENLRGINPPNEQVTEIVGELEKDVNRLELVADRFSKIGSLPTLEEVNLVDQLSKIGVYMKKRASRRITFNFPSHSDKPVYANINPHLFDWVFENLIRNSLDAMDGEGDISAKLRNEGEWVIIDLTDTGKGIAPSKHKKIFEPGYSTKKRGWGLGLSLAKRIIEQYHKGKIFVRKSDLNKGTTFYIQLPAVNS